MKSALNEYKSKKMIDQQTRSIYILMNLYNPNNEIMSYVRVGFEISEQGMFRACNFYRTVHIDISTTRYTNMFDSFTDF